MSPRKHTRFFAFEVEEPSFRGPAPQNPSVPYAVADVDAYHALFAGVTSETAIGEASHSYLYRPQAPARIRAYARGMKLIAILRDPAERAYSHYRQMVRDGREPVAKFVQALKEEGARIRDHWWPDFHYVQIGLYQNQVKRYYDLFGRDQLKIYLYEDLQHDPSGVLQDMFRFLDVKEAFVPETSLRYNASGVPKNRALHLSLEKLRRARPFIAQVVPERQFRRLLRIGSYLHNRNLVKSQLSPEVREKVIDEYFREDILNLQHLMQRDLSAWLR